MEDNDIFKKMEAKIKSLEQQLSQCDETIKLCEQSGIFRVGAVERRREKNTKYTYSLYTIRDRGRGAD